MSIGEILVSIAVAILVFSGKLGKMNLEFDGKKQEKDKQDAK